MGQTEVYHFLKNKRLSGDEGYFSCCDVERGLRDEGFTNGVIASVRRSLVKLEIWGDVDIKMSGKFRDWKRLYKISDRELKREI